MVTLEPRLHEQTDTHDWKHYLCATSLAGGNKSSFFFTHDIIDDINNIIDDIIDDFDDTTNNIEQLCHKPYGLLVLDVAIHWPVVDIIVRCCNGTRYHDRVVLATVNYCDNKVSGESQSK